MVEKKIEYAATGRRKTAVARVRLVPGTGQWRVNGQPIVDYFSTKTLAAIAQKPLDITETLDSFDVRAQLRGGGPSGQAGALRHALARALVYADEAHKAVLKKNGFLTRDPRMKERKKYGQPGARKRFQFSKR